MRIGLLGKSKLGFVFPKSKFGLEYVDIWEKCNAVVLSWIMNVVRPGLLSSVVYSNNAHRVWCDLNERFDKINGAHVFHLHKEIHSLSQGTLLVTDYYTTLKSLWNKFDSIMPCPGCFCDKSKKFKEHCEYQRLLQFLMGLNESYSAARGQILLQTPTPNLNKTFSLILNHESQRNLMHTSSDTSIHRTIEMCGYRGYTKEQCFKVKGYLVGWRSKKKGGTTYSHTNSYANQVEVSQPAATNPNSPAPAGFFTQNQYQQIMQMLAKGSKNAGEHSVKEAFAGSILSALVSKYVPMEWIIDTGETDHMNASLDILDRIQPVPNSERRKVQLPTGNVASVSHIGRTKDLSNGLIRGIDREEQGLYILKEDFINSVPVVVPPSAYHSTNTHSTPSSQIESIYLWHRILGHVSEKIAPRALSAVLMGYSMSQKGYILYDLHSKSLFVNRNVVFKEDVFPFKDLQISSNPLFPVLTLPTQIINPSHMPPPPPSLLPHFPSPHSNIYPDQSLPSSDLPSQANVLLTRKSSRQTKPPLWLQDFVTANHNTSSSYPISLHMSYAHLSLTYAYVLDGYSAITEPTSYSEASLVLKWVQAMELEIAAL
ncbi:uncharacterized protein LOC129881985 [Solanum dulcamara]|uniref:uncharacterized protein LOC129881985 n=1 Tax=Solanum dulcamara TaxID=45834 RepID=UPI002485CF1D|nr:uncharacterized protein LOC129881985 [Solanum dulcamara]